jgi:HEAT repeat protein
MRAIPVILLVALVGGCTAQPVDTSARVNYWTTALRAPDAKLRKEAAFKLGNLGLCDPDTIVPALTVALRDTESGVRREAILALMKCGAHAQDATPTLTELSRRDSDANVRRDAEKALQTLASRAP